MNSSQPIEIVQSIYAEFGRGDIDALVARLHPEVRVVVHAPESIPYAGTRRGPEEVARWFGELGAAMAFDRIEPETIIASGDEVAVRGVEAGTSRATGRRYESGFVHVWKVQDGLVVRLDDFMDSAAVVEALAA